MAWKCSIFCVCLISMTSNAMAQIKPSPTSAQVRMDGYKSRAALETNSIIKHLPYKAIGPTIQSGRVTDIDVNPADPSIFFVAYASGGLWKTENNGTSFTPLFDNEMVMTIGDIAVDWKNNQVWIGTGENNSSRSSYAGVGLYKSTDGGKTWQHRGLPESHHIGRIIIHPTNPDIVWVAVLGHLYSANPERGVYMTTDGGLTWKHVLYINDNTGAIDLIIEPGNAKVLYAATWHRERRAWNFVEAGEGSGIFKSMDGGLHWQRLNSKSSGFPYGAGVGRIGIAIHKGPKQTTLYAIVDNNDRQPPKPKEENVLVLDDFRTLSREQALKLDDAQFNRFLREQGFPSKYDAKAIKNLIEQNKITPQTLVEYREDANMLLFNTQVKGAEVYSSKDQGKSWTKTHEGYLDGLYYSYGYYFGQVFVAPQDVNKVYTFGVPIIKSTDGGKNWQAIDGDNVHSDHHALWINPRRAGHLILGNDGGINISYDDGKSWIKCNTPPVGQFYHLAVDMATPFNVYGGLQDNGVYMGPHNNTPSTSWHDGGQYPFKAIYGGDGMQTAVDTRDNQTIYTGSQFGNYVRLNLKSGQRKNITPSHELGERPMRWNWQSPIHLSVHNQDILYMGSNKLHRSLNQGDAFDVISPDLTKGGLSGDIAFGTLTTIHESPVQFGLVYTGSDDGLVHVTKDGGATWTNISSGLPSDLWISRVEASRFEKSRVYLSLNGYRWDNFGSYIFRSDDYGDHWTPIGPGLPSEPVNVIKEDPANADLIYVGTDHGLYISLDGGQTFMTTGNNFPAVAVHDIVVHPRDKMAVVGTHGRSIYTFPVGELQKMTPETQTQDFLVFSVPEARFSSFYGRKFSSFSPARQPDFSIPIFSNREDQLVTLTVLLGDLSVYEKSLHVPKGISYVPYPLVARQEVMKDMETKLNTDAKEPIIIKAADDGHIYLRPGKYELKISVGGLNKSTTLVIK